ncbi:MAG TPA: RDD family protein [Humisphaera sp.]
MLERKGLPIRLAAAVVDAVVVGFTATALGIALGRVGAVLAALLYIGYPALEILKGQSVGKMILKLNVTAASGQPATRDQMVRRSMLRWGPLAAAGVLSLVSVVLPFVAFLAMPLLVVANVVLLVMSLKTFQATNQALWDVRADTAVMGAPAAAVPVAVAPATAPAAPPVTPQA